METTHEVAVGDARAMGVPDEAVDCVVTSPPYPMIEMWDEAFAAMDPAIEDALAAGDGDRAFAAMHAQLDRVWDELARVVADGAVVCLVVGDATRSIDGAFRRYQNAARITEAMVDRGFRPLPEILWRKPTNSAAKFMGSGMVPPNAYVTLEHEHVLLFRKGDRPRSLAAGDPRRYEAAYFYEERNRWFSDLWTDVRGIDQRLDGDGRDRSGAFPLAVPYRLVSMFSVYGDTVLDPFLGTGTTTIATMCAGRHSIGIERRRDLLAGLDDRVRSVPALSKRIVRRRLEAHREAVDRARQTGEQFAYTADAHDVPVRSKQSREIRLRTVASIAAGPTGYRLDHAVDDQTQARSTE